ncbi:MAG: Arginine/ornithine antiporter ArcD [uncultured Sulfurovum sp.]|uniref:Arginine/ornithine antiporter ArcD n=1 Tax=uncultured Sulfurovum sp. TaxID=269237 RepID=A0A6S6U9J2_9BACT|nr:MAG: Arginine/ornithine antiporter ArcD [uncultured Sulfurovum sp.]
MHQFDSSTETSCISHSFAILLIPFLFLLGVILAFFQVFPLNVEAHTLLIVAFIFVVFVFFVKHNANYAVCHMRGTFSKMEEELHTALRDNALTIMGKTKSTLHVKDFISEYYQDIRNDNFARVASSVFPMLGILGTFIAIALSMPDFSVENTAALDHEISVLLSGIGTAFYASIYGIMLSLIWTYFEKRGMAKVDKQILELEKIYGSRVWKNAELLKHQHMQSALKDQEIVETLKETFNIDFIKQLNAQHLENYKAIAEETNNSFTKLSVNMEETSKVLTQTLERVYGKKETTNALLHMQDNFTAFNSNTQVLQHTMNRFDETMNHTFGEIDRELGQAVEKLGTFARIISEQNQLILNNIATLKENEKKLNGKK